MLVSEEALALEKVRPPANQCLATRGGHLLSRGASHSLGSQPGFDSMTQLDRFPKEP